MKFVWKGGGKSSEKRKYHQNIFQTIYNTKENRNKQKSHPTSQRDFKCIFTRRKENPV